MVHAHGQVWFCLFNLLFVENRRIVLVFDEIGFI